MDWGKGIIITLVAFGILMIGLVTFCIKQDDIHLVTQNYYEEEIKYQDQIEKMINASEIGYNVLVYDNQLKKLDLMLPKGAKGILHLFRPSDARLDQKIAFDISETNKSSVDVKDLKPGYWRIKLSWSEDGKEFYEEKKINI
jgi:hypothetical protein